MFHILLGCSDDDPEPVCFQEDSRKIIATITNANGTIQGPKSPYCEDGYTIEPDEKMQSRPLGLYFPCNLPNELRIDGTIVVFSGYVYESFENEDICADFFEITDIGLHNQ